jgi:hypothetical protein
MPDTDTLAATLPNWVGAEKPVGTLTEMFVLPEAPGRNALSAVADPAGIVTGEVMMVPTFVFELTTLTLTGGTPVIAATG